MRVAIGTPVKNHTVTVEYHASLWQLARWPGFEYTFYQSPEDLVRCRSRLVRWFLEETSCDKLIMWDSDIAPNPRVVLKMMELPFDIVAARYRQKLEKVVYIPLLPVDAKPDEYNTFSVDYIPMGLVCMSRKALQKMVDHYRDELECQDLYHGKMKPTVMLFNLIRETVERDWSGMGAPIGSKVLLSEDYSFSKRARALDIPIHLMVEPVPHVGDFVFV